MTTATVQYLISTECVYLRSDRDDAASRLVVSGLGDAIFRCGMTPEEGIQVYESLQQASQCFITEHPFHGLYLVGSGAWRFHCAALQSDRRGLVDWCVRQVTPIGDKTFKLFPRHWERLEATLRSVADAPHTGDKAIVQHVFNLIGVQVRTVVRISWRRRLRVHDADGDNGAAAAAG